MSKKNLIFKSSIINSIILSIFGILLIAQSEATIVTISYIIGGILVALGVIAVLRYLKNANNLEKSELDIVYGIVCTIMGILVIKNPQAIASIIPFIIGIIIVINSATKLQVGLELKKKENELWISTLVVSIIMTICGVALIFNPFQGAVIFTKVVGIFILVYAVLDIVSTVIIKNTFNKMTDLLEKPIKDAEIIEEEQEEETPEESNKKDKKKKKSKKEKNDKQEEEAWW